MGDVECSVLSVAVRLYLTSGPGYDGSAVRELATLAEREFSFQHPLVVQLNQLQGMQHPLLVSEETRHARGIQTCM